MSLLIPYSFALVYAGGGWVAANGRRCGRLRVGCMAGRLPALQAGVGHGASGTPPPTGRCGGPMAAAAGGCGRGAWPADCRRYRRAWDTGRRGRRPLRAGRPRICHCEPVRTLAWQSVPPVPFFNVFKWQFENTAIIHYSFFIFHFPSGRVRVGSGGQAMLVPTGSFGRALWSKPTPPPALRPVPLPLAGEVFLLPVACCPLPVACCLVGAGRGGRRGVP